VGFINQVRAIATLFAARLNLRSERAATAVEYAVMVALIAAVIILAVLFLGQETSETFSEAGNCLAQDGNC
jgi:pilus assembly protein Flp/PilA